MTATTPVYAGASTAAIEHHYDLSDDFFRLWLDRDLTYSCALWEEDDTLEQAQVRKLDHHARGAGVVRGGTVLDVGCGWGSLLRRVTSHHGASHAVGLTLSHAQGAFAHAAGWPGCEVRVEHWADHTPRCPYDAVISIGAFEHFAREGLPRTRRVEAYREFFRWCHSVLRPGGRLSLQTNVKGPNVRLDRQTAAELRFICDSIFPESELPWLSEVLEASERLFDTVSIRNNPDHYARTCGAWLERLRGNREAAVGLVGEATTADYERYLASSVRHFQHRHLGLIRATFARLGDTETRS